MTKNIEKEELTKDELFQVLQFADGLYQTNYFTPQMLNQNLIGLNIQPLKPTYDKLIRAINNSQYSPQELQGYSEWLSVADGLFSKTTNYFYDDNLKYKFEYSACKSVKDILSNNSKNKSPMVFSPGGNRNIIQHLFIQPHIF